MNISYTAPKGGGLYVIWLSDTHYYGGRTEDFGSRWRTHLSCLLQGKHNNKHFQAVFNLYGRFEPEVLTGIPKELQKEAEQIWLDLNVGEPGCVNLSATSEGWGGKHSEETKAKMRGRTHSDESRERIREARARQTFSEETREKMSQAGKGRKLSPEHVQILVQSSKERVWDEAARKKHSDAHLGITRSEESRAKQSATVRASPELRQKARESLAVNSLKITPKAVAVRARKTAEKLRGRTQSPEHVQNSALGRTGLKRTEATKLRMSESAKARALRQPTSHDAETRALISQQQKGRVRINDGKTEKSVTSEEVQALLDAGWLKGSLEKPSMQGLVWIRSPDGEYRRVKEEALPPLLDEGWVRGIPPKTVGLWVHLLSTGERRRVSPEDLAGLLSKGWQAGQGPVTPMAWVHNPATGEQKRVSVDSLQEWLDLGWVRGQPGSSASQKGRVWINDGLRNRKVFPAELPDLLEAGWVRGVLPGRVTD